MRIPSFCWQVPAIAVLTSWSQHYSVVAARYSSSSTNIRPLSFVSWNHPPVAARKQKTFTRPRAVSVMDHGLLRNETLLASYATIPEPRMMDYNRMLPFQKASHGSIRIVIPPGASTPMEASLSSQHQDDPYTSLNNFRSRLEATIAYCREQQASSIWVEVPMSRGRLLEEMTSLGFRFHHAEGETASLNLWLKDSNSKIPEYATHHIGVGAVVINSRQEILCVRELRGNYLPWKIPGGLAELGEHIPEAVVREVLEETGVPTRFVHLLSFRHSHGMAHGRSDLYFVCRLEPIESRDAQGHVIMPKPIPQQCEIAEAAWIPLQEYRAMVENNHPMMNHILKLIDSNRCIEQTLVHSVVPGRPPNPIYHPPL